MVSPVIFKCNMLKRNIFRLTCSLFRNIHSELLHALVHLLMNKALEWEFQTTTNGDRVVFT